MKLEQLHPVTQQQIRGMNSTHSGCYLFVGPLGSGKHAAALDFASSKAHARSEYIFRVSPEHSERGGIKIAQVRAMLVDLQLAPITSDQHRLVILERADSMGPEAANLLLKTLEEPPENTIFILTARSGMSVLPTIRSRAQIIRFLPQESGATDEEAAQLADAFLKGDTTARFGVAKQLHDNPGLTTNFLRSLYEAGRAHNRYDILEQLLRVEESLAHNVNIRLAIEWLAMEISE